MKDTARSGPGEFDQLAVSVWLRLLKAHGLLLQKLRRRVPPELTLPQFDVLAQLHRRPEGMTPSALTRELLVTPGNVTGIVARLASLGLVERQAVPEDRRAVRLRLTRRGERLMGAAIPRHRREVGALFTSVDAARLEHLRDLLGELGRGLEAHP